MKERMRFSTKYAAGVGKQVKGQAGKTVTEKPQKTREEKIWHGKQTEKEKLPRARGTAQEKGNRPGKGLGF